jgi:hypothetical protein
MADNHTAVFELIVYRKCWILDVSQPYGPSRHVTGITLHLLVNLIDSSARTTSQTPFFYCFMRVPLCGDKFIEPFLRNGLQNPVVLSLSLRTLRALPSNGPCLQSHFTVGPMCHNMKEMEYQRYMYMKEQQNFSFLLSSQL